MRDQADDLRQLVLRSVVRQRNSEFPAPPLVVVSGGKGGVGATTVAVNLAVALARQGQRTVLVDADLDQPDATGLCQLKESDSIADVLTGRRTVHEVLQRGPAGIQVLPGVWAPDAPTACTPLAQQRMLAELGRLGGHADVVVLDLGSGLDAVAARFWQAASLVLLVTTSEAASVMDAYATIKMLAGSGHSPEIFAVVNMADDRSDADDAGDRIGQACRRFLKRNITAGPTIPLDRLVHDAALARRPLITPASGSAAAAAIEHLAERVVTATKDAASRPPTVEAA